MAAASAPALSQGPPFADALIPAVQRLVSSPIRERIRGATLTTFAIGGEVRALVTVESVEELARVLSRLSRESQEFRVIGNGSNVLFGDESQPIWLIKLGGGFRRSEPISRSALDVFGAAPLMSLARRVSEDGLSGLEFAAGIPASIGGAVFMNAGAHGSEICERIEEVRGLLADGSEAVWSRGDLPWRYRHSGLPSGAIVTSVRLTFTEGDRDRISATCAHNLAERRARQPLALPSAGSVFKNPSPELPAGKLLERLGMKGFTIGGAMVSEMHANWIVNPKREATARDVSAVIDACRERARSEAGIDLEPEVRLWATTP